jgi:hypothetical protein
MQMFFHNVSAVAITDENGKLVANFSASELRGLGHKNFDWLLLKISDFLGRIASITPGVPRLHLLVPCVPCVPCVRCLTEPAGPHAQGKLLFPLTCRKTTHIEDAINMLGTYRVHRLWLGTWRILALSLHLSSDVLRVSCRVVRLCCVVSCRVVCRVRWCSLVDDQGKPEGLISLTDVMRLLLPNDAIPEPAGKPPGRRKSWIEEPAATSTSSSSSS